MLNLRHRQRQSRGDLRADRNSPHMCDTLGHHGLDDEGVYLAPGIALLWSLLMLELWDRLFTNIPLVPDDAGYRAVELASKLAQAIGEIN